MQAAYCAASAGNGDEVGGLAGWRVYRLARTETEPNLAKPKQHPCGPKALEQAVTTATATINQYGKGTLTTQRLANKKRGKMINCVDYILRACVCATV